MAFGHKQRFQCPNRPESRRIGGYFQREERPHRERLTSMVMRNCALEPAKQGASSGPGSWGSNPCPAASTKLLQEHTFSVWPCDRVGPSEAVEAMRDRQSSEAPRGE